MEARDSLQQEWPEPQTSQFHALLCQSALAIVGSILGRKEPELSAEIATKALLGLSKFQGRSLFSTWFYRLAHNEAIRHVQARRHIALEDLLEEPAARKTAEGLPEGLSGLRASDKRLVQLVLDGYNTREIGQKLHVSHATVARQWLKLCEKLKFLLSS